MWRPQRWALSREPAASQAPKVPPPMHRRCQGQLLGERESCRNIFPSQGPLGQFLGTGGVRKLDGAGPGRRSPAGPGFETDGASTEEAGGRKQSGRRRRRAARSSPTGEQPPRLLLGNPKSAARIQHWLQDAWLKTHGKNATEDVAAKRRAKSELELR